MVLKFNVAPALIVKSWQRAIIPVPKPTVTLCAITTLWLDVGITPPTQVALLFQFPFAADVIVVGVNSSTVNASINGLLLPYLLTIANPTFTLDVRYLAGIAILILFQVLATLSKPLSTLDKVCQVAPPLLDITTLRLRATPDPSALKYQKRTYGEVEVVKSKEGDSIRLSVWAMEVVPKS